MKQKKPRDRMVNVGRRTLMYDNRSALHNNFIAPKKYRDPFRISDERMVIGKYRGYKLKDIDISYIRWMHDNLEMDSTHKSILKDIITKASNE